MTEFTVDQRSVMKGLTMQIRVTGKARQRACIWAAGRLLRLASIVLGTNATIQVDLDTK